MSVKWHFIIVLIYVSLMTNEVRYLIIGWVMSSPSLICPVCVFCSCLFLAHSAQSCFYICCSLSLKLLLLLPSVSSSRKPSLTAAQDVRLFSLVSLTGRKTRCHSPFISSPVTSSLLKRLKASTAWPPQDSFYFFQFSCHNLKFGRFCIKKI